MMTFLIYVGDQNLMSLWHMHEAWKTVSGAKFFIGKLPMFKHLWRCSCNW